MAYQKYTDSSNKTVEYFVSHLSKEGTIQGPDVEEDPAFYYKLPSLLFEAGRRTEATGVLSHIEECFVSSDGDVRASSDVKTQNGALCIYPAYINGWVARAALLANSSDLYKKLEKFFLAHKSATGGWCNIRDGEDLDLLTTAHFGRLALLNKDMDTAKAAADFIVRALKQNSFTDVFYTRYNTDAKAVTTPPEGQDVFCAISSRQPNQLYFFLGYPAAFLGLVYMESKQEEYLLMAKQILDFCLQCDESIYRFHFAHKVAWAASIVAAITRDAKYGQLASRIADFLLTLQGESGLFLEDGDAIDKYDQSAEIAQWLRDIAAYLAKV